MTDFCQCHAADYFAATANLDPTSFHAAAGRPPRARARDFSGCPVIESDFSTYDFSQHSFAAVTLIGALVHLPETELAPTLQRSLPPLPLTRVWRTISLTEAVPPSRGGERKGKVGGQLTARGLEFYRDLGAPDLRRGVDGERDAVEGVEDRFSEHLAHLALVEELAFLEQEEIVGEQRR